MQKWNTCDIRWPLNAELDNVTTLSEGLLVGKRTLAVIIFYF